MLGTRAHDKMDSTEQVFLEGAEDSFFFFFAKGTWENGRQSTRKDLAGLKTKES